MRNAGSIPQGVTGASLAEGPLSGVYRPHEASVLAIAKAIKDELILL
jgi:hypothetical protein